MDVSLEQHYVADASRIVAFPLDIKKPFLLHSSWQEEELFVTEHGRFCHGNNKTDSIMSRDVKSSLSGEGCYQPWARSWKGGCIWPCLMFVRCLSGHVQRIYWTDFDGIVYIVNKNPLTYPLAFWVLDSWLETPFPLQWLQLCTCLFIILSQITVDW